VPARIEESDGGAVIFDVSGASFELNASGPLAEQLGKIFSRIAAPTDWGCGKCTYLNSGSRDNCEMCDGPKHAPKPSDEPTTASRLIEPAAAIEDMLGTSTTVATVPASVVAADGAEYSLGEVEFTATILSVKKLLATKSVMRVGSQSMFLIDDTRQGVDNLELKNQEKVSDVLQYAESATDLKLAVMMDLLINDAAEFVQKLTPQVEPTLTIGNGGGADADDRSLNYPKNACLVPAHPDLLIVAACDSHQLRVFRRDMEEQGAPPTLVCTVGKGDARKGSAEREFYEPWGLAISQDSTHVLVSEERNNRVQVLKLVVGERCSRSQEKSAVSLEFVRFIADGQLKSPRGLALRQVSGRETVIVAEFNGDCLSEFHIDDGSFVRTFGEEEGGMNEEGRIVCSSPTDVAFMPQTCEIAVAGFANDCILIYDESGRFIRQFGGSCQGSTSCDGHFKNPRAVTTDSHGHLLVLDQGTGRLQVFDSEGRHLRTRNDLGIMPSGVKGMHWSPELCCLVIANGRKHNVLLFTSD
jgi:hypothetical protein